jgi:tetratricopeptide (TPR) repeat protein
MSCRDRGMWGVVRGSSGGVFVVALVGLELMIQAKAGAQATAEARPALQWVGQRVVQKARAFALDGDKAVSAQSSRPISVYRVEKVDGARLWLKAEGDAGRPSGWARAAEVVPTDQAVAFFTERIQVNPEDGFACLMRAAIRTGAIERRHDLFDRAPSDRDPFADPDKAIRPEAPPAGNPAIEDLRLWPAGRGAAITDFTIAIRLDPKDVSAYRGRGLVQVRREAYDRAVLDLNRAIGLDPKNALAYYGRGRAWAGQGDPDKAIADYNEAIRLDPKSGATY